MKVEDYKELFEQVKEYDSYLSGLDSDYIIDSDNYVIVDLRDAITLISSGLYEVMPEKDRNLMNFLNTNEVIKASDVREKLRSWVAETEHDMKCQLDCFICLDRDFEKMMLTVERCSEGVLVKRLISRLTAFAEMTPSNFNRLIAVYTELEHLWGGFDPEAGNYAHFINGVHAVKEHVEDIRWLYNTVDDYRSRKVIYGLIKFWLELDFEYKNTLVEGNYDDYFDLDVFKGRVTEEEVFVDCGSYTGDTAKAYLRNFSGYRRMYLYDMVPANLRKAEEELADQDQIIYRNVGVGNTEQSGTEIVIKDAQSTTLSLLGGTESVNPELNNVDAKEVSVRIVTIDEDIKEKITFLKMDIEGAEIDALQGARNHIVNDHPKLAICTYHHYEHLWEIPQLIRSMSPDYKIYIRYNDAVNSVTASEHVVLAV